MWLPSYGLSVHIAGLCYVVYFLHFGFGLYFSCQQEVLTSCREPDSFGLSFMAFAWPRVVLKQLAAPPDGASKWRTLEKFEEDLPPATSASAYCLSIDYIVCPCS